MDSFFGPTLFLTTMWRMSVPRTRCTAALAISAVMLLTGCSTGGGFVPTMTPSAEPFFASEEEALEAVVAHYQEYLAVSDAVYADGGANPERLRPYVSDERYEEELSSAEEFANKGLQTEGKTRIYNPLVQMISHELDITNVNFYVCVDITQVALFDNHRVRLPDVEQVFPYVVFYKADNQGGLLRLMLLGGEYWEGNYVC